MNTTHHAGSLFTYPFLDLQLLCVASSANATLPAEAGLGFVEIGRSGSAESSGTRIAKRQVKQELLAPFEVTFEQAVENLERLSGVFIEPDGFLMWHSRDSGDPWQLSGMLYDRPLHAAGDEQAGRVCSCEFKGAFPASVWQSVLDCLGTDNERLVAYLQPQKCFVTVADLRSIWGE